MPSALGRGRHQKNLCLLWKISALSQVQGPKTVGRYSPVGLQGSCNMEVIVGVDANDDVVLLSQSCLCQCFLPSLLDGGGEERSAWKPDRTV